MLRTILCTVALTCFAPAHASGQEAGPGGEKTDNSTLAQFFVDTAPGAVSAMSMLGVGADQTTVVENPGHLTVALKALDGKNAFGLGITPARTSLVPLSVKSYAKNPVARLWGATTFSYAQTRAEVAGKEFDRRAYAVETSIFLSEMDDPLIRYWRAVEQAQAGKNDVCLYDPSAPQDETWKPGWSKVDPTEKQTNDTRAEACRARVEKAGRWNASRAWASWASGNYRPTAGGESHSLGRTIVLGLTWGVGKADATAAAITLAAKRTTDSPVLKSLGDASPVRKSNDLAVLRIAVGSSTIRALFEGSNARDDEPSAASRTFKRALGIDARLAAGLWLNFRAGKQRRIDNSGDENASSFNLSYSPKAVLGN